MRKARRGATSLRTWDAEVGTLLLGPEVERPTPPRPLPKARKGDRIRAALLRWLEEEL